MSDALRRARTRPVTVRIPVGRLRRLMRARGLATQSELVNVLLAEEEERLHAHRVLVETAGSARAGELDDRLL